jgi:hypothetical protein
VQSESSAGNGPQVERLQGIGLKISGDVSEQTGSDVSIVANAGLNEVGGCARDGARSVVGRVNSICVQRQLVSQ